MDVIPCKIKGARMSQEQPSSAGGSGWFRRNKQEAPAAEEPEKVRTFHLPDPIDSSMVFGVGQYRATQSSVLLTRYIRIRGDLSAAYQKYPDRKDDAIRCADYLDAVRKELEKSNSKLAVCANLLDLADRELASLYSPDILRYRMDTILCDIQRMDISDSEKKEWRSRLTHDAGDNGTDGSDQSKERSNAINQRLVTALKDARTFINGCDEQALIEDDLQVTRLKGLVFYLVFAWAALLLVIPFVTKVQVTNEGVAIWPLKLTGVDTLNLVLAAGGLSLVGAVGGIISGMFTVRDGRAILAEYRTSMWKLALKPLVGAVAALTLYLFLSSQIIEGVNVSNPGLYIVSAFFAGFSERYFLRVLRAQESKAGGLPGGSVDAVAGTATAPTMVPRTA
jgi:hypothetical protein